MHLAYEQRCQIYALKKSGHSLRNIAKQLAVHTSTISRELSRNTGKRGYRYNQAQERADERRRVASRVKTKMTPELISEIEEKIRGSQWSPEQVSGWMKKGGRAPSAIKAFIGMCGLTSGLVGICMDTYAIE